MFFLSGIYPRLFSEVDNRFRLIKKGKQAYRSVVMDHGHLLFKKYRQTHLGLGTIILTDYYNDFL